MGCTTTYTRAGPGRAAWSASGVAVSMWAGRSRAWPRHRGEQRRAPGVGWPAAWAGDDVWPSLVCVVVCWVALRSPARVPNVRPVLPRRLLPASSSSPLVPLGVLVSPVIRPLRASRVRRSRPFGSSPVGCIVCVGAPPSLLCPSDREWPHFYSPRICLVPGVPRALHVCQLARCACAPRLPVRARCLSTPFRVSCVRRVRVGRYVRSVHIHTDSRSG